MTIFKLSHTNKSEPPSLRSQFVVLSPELLYNWQLSFHTDMSSFIFQFKGTSWPMRLWQTPFTTLLPLWRSSFRSYKIKNFFTIWI